MAAISLTLKVDNISPSLQALSDPALRRRMLQAAGTLMESYAVRAFDEPAIRPAPWPARKKAGDGHPLLLKSGDLRQSIHFQVHGEDSVVVGSPKPYAAVHQLGSSKKHISPRPYFPVLNGQLTSEAEADLTDTLSGIVNRAAHT